MKLRLLLFFLLFLIPVCSASVEENNTSLTITGNTESVIDTYPEVIREITVNDTGRLILNGITSEIIDSNKTTHLTINLWGDAVIEVTDSVIPAKIYLHNNSQAIITNSSIGIYHSCPAHGYHFTGGLYLYEQSTATISDSIIDNLQPRDMAEASIHRTRIEYIINRDLESTSKVTLHECKVYRLMIEPGDLTVIENIKRGVYHMWNSSSVFNVGDIVFYDTELVNGSHITLRNAEFRVTNCDFYGLAIENSTGAFIENTDSWYISVSTLHGPINVQNSTLGALSFFMCPEGPLLLENSDVGRFGYMSSGLEVNVVNSSIDILDAIFNEYNTNKTMVHSFSDTFIREFQIGSAINGSLTYHFNNTVVEGFKYASLGMTHITGDLTILNKTLPSFLDLDHEYYLMREYPVYVSKEGVPVDRAYLELSNGTQIIWSGYTDQHGKAVVPILFMTWFQINNPVVTPELPRIQRYENITGTLSLRADLSGESQELNLTIVSDTPIVFDYEPDNGYKIPYGFTLIGVIFYSVVTLRKRRIH